MVEATSMSSNMTFSPPYLNAPVYPRYMEILNDAWVYWQFIAGFFAIVGNSLTIFAVARYEWMKSPTNFVIMSLALSDLLSCFVAPLMYFNESSWGFAYYKYGCAAQNIITLVSSLGNILSTFLVTVERYLYIVEPFRYPTLARDNNVVRLLLIIWCLLILTVTTSVLHRITYVEPRRCFPFTSFVSSRRERK